MAQDAAAEASAQLRRGVLEYCVLALLRHDEMYATDVVRRLAGVQGLSTSEGTVYPLLSRLRRDGLLSSRLEESPAGPARRYYRLTADGANRLDAFMPQWRQFRTAVDSIITPGEH